MQEPGKDGDEVRNMEERNSSWEGDDINDYGKASERGTGMDCKASER